MAGEVLLEERGGGLEDAVGEELDVHALGEVERCCSVGWERVIEGYGL